MTKRLKDILSDMSCRIIGDAEKVEVSSIVYDSREVKAGTLFVCIRGATRDAHHYIPEVIKSGAKVILIQGDQDVFEESSIIAFSVTNDVVFVICDNTRLALAKISEAYYDYPARSLQLLGVTGTKGKTTTTFMLHEILSVSDPKVGLVGTVFDIIDGERIKASRTTPEANDLQSFFRQMADSGARSCVIEVSSLGLVYERVADCRFFAGAFTNLFHDHISSIEHKDMDDYLNAKLRLFDRSEHAVINMDTEVSNSVIDRASTSSRVWTYGLKEGADCIASDIRSKRKRGVSGTQFHIKSPWYKGEVFLSLPGQFNIYNALCAISMAGLMGVPFEQVKQGLLNVSVPGRMQAVPNDLDLSIYVDYAHNAGSLETVLKMLREYAKGRVIAVFGCGGNRSKTRRSEMGEVSGRYSDMTVVTSDNPRDEAPESIIRDILEGINTTEGLYIVEEDRARAIRAAIRMAGPDDVVLIAGKGHEDYQIFGNTTIHFDDVEVARAELLELERDRK